MKYFKSALYLLLTFFSFSQNDIIWGEVQEEKSDLQQIIPLSESSFYSISIKPTSGLGIDTIFILNRYENLKKVSFGNLQLKIREKLTHFEGFKLVNDQICVFLSIIEGTDKILYVQKYTKECLPTETPFEISRYAIPNKLTRKGNYSIVQSENKAYIAVYSEIPGTKKENDQLIHAIYNNKWELISKGQIFSNLPADKIRISNSFLTQKGELFVVSKVFNTSESFRLNKADLLVDKIQVEELIKDGSSINLIELDSATHVSTFSIAESKNTLVFVSLLSDKDEISTKNFFTFKLDLGSKKILSHKIFALKQEKLKSLWNVLLGSEEKPLFQYKINYLSLQEDGSFLLGLEQNYQKMKSPDLNGTNNTLTYFYNDILLYKIKANDEIAWETKIDKYQKSFNDGAPNSSFISFLKKDKWMFYFNDNLGNYDTEGLFFQCHAATDFSVKSTILAQVEVNVLTGESKRKVFIKKNDSNILLSPKKSINNFSKQQLILFSYFNSKEKFGLMNY